jgi:hypothetical protein
MTTTMTTAAAQVAELETKHQQAHKEYVRAQALAIALPGRLAAGDETVTTADLIHAGPAVSVAQAKVTALGNQLAAAREALEQARTAELVARLQAGDPFLNAAMVDKELDRISAYVLRELAKLGSRISAHNDAFHAVAGTLPRGVHKMGELTVRHDSNGKTLELDGAEWWAMATDGYGQDVLNRVAMAEAQARDARRGPLFLSAP